MPTTTFARRAETFGFDRESWATDALRLLYNVPRTYEPLVRAWEHHYPGTRAALRRLGNAGFVAYQPEVVMDTRSGTPADKPGRSVRRFRTTAKGRRLLAAVVEDDRNLEDAFPKTSVANLAGVHALLDACDLDGSHARYGISQGHAVEISGLTERTGRWWIARLVRLGYLRELPDRWADTRAVIPAHWRVTRQLSRQLGDVFEAFDVDPLLRAELRLERSRYLEDIDPARLGISGATDFDHDVVAQRILASLLYSPACVTEGRILVEPRHFLPLTKTTVPWEFRADGASTLFYQPDAELRERDSGGRLRRCVVEYERYQTRRDGWNHIERFLGYLHTKTLPVEAATLRFVVDSTQRVQSYRELIEAFADWSSERPELMPSNDVVLAVSSVTDVLEATDPLDDRHWFKIALARPVDAPRVVVHPKTSTPYDDYFSR